LRAHTFRQSLFFFISVSTNFVYYLLFPRIEFPPPYGIDLVTPRFRRLLIRSVFLIFSFNKTFFPSPSPPPPPCEVALLSGFSSRDRRPHPPFQQLKAITENSLAFFDLYSCKSSLKHYPPSVANFSFPSSLAHKPPSSPPSFVPPPYSPQIKSSSFHIFSLLLWFLSIQQIASRVSPFPRGFALAFPVGPPSRLCRYQPFLNPNPSRCVSPLFCSLGPPIFSVFPSTILHFCSGPNVFFLQANVQSPLFPSDPYTLSLSSL